MMTPPIQADLGLIFCKRIFDLVWSNLKKRKKMWSTTNFGGKILLVGKKFGMEIFVCQKFVLIGNSFGLETKCSLEKN
jgi:hypothetical protein